MRRGESSVTLDGIHTIVLGPEHDPALRSAVIEVLRELDAELQDRSWGVAGSQEVERVVARLPMGTIVVESETYAGLSISGPMALVERVVTLVRQKLPSAG